MKKALLIFSALSALALAAAGGLLELRDFYGYGFGLLLFGVNLGLLAFLAARLLGSPVGGKVTALSNPLFIGLMPIKFVLIGLGTYLALVRFDLSPWFFVGGAASALAFAATAFAVKTPAHLQVEQKSSVTT